MKMMRMLRTVANVSTPLIIGMSLRSDDVAVAGASAVFLTGQLAVAGYKLMQMVGMAFGDP